MYDKFRSYLTLKKKMQSKQSLSATEQTIYTSLMHNPVVDQENVSLSSFYNL